VIDPSWTDESGVPITTILFGGRRENTVPLVYKARNWNHGVFLGAQMSSEQTSAAEGKVGEVRNDPFAMLPFCGYNMGDYFKHWLNIGRKNKDAELPSFAYVNWFRKNSNGYLWPGFGENIRVLKWILEDSENKSKRQETPIGILPNKQGLDLTGLTSVSDANLQELLQVNKTEWQKEANKINNYFKNFGEKIPAELWGEVEKLKNI